MSDDDIKLPPLPVIEHWLRETYTAAQMREYARAAVLADREARQQWISVDDRLPEWSMRDDTPCYLYGKPIGALLQSQLVLVTLDSGAVRMDRLEGIEDYGAPFWQTYRQRVVAWMPPPAPANAQRGKENSPQSVNPADAAMQRESGRQECPTPNTKLSCTR